MNDSNPYDLTRVQKGKPLPRDDGAPDDRELLFARLAVLNGFVDEETLEAARQTDSPKALGDCLVDCGAMTEKTRRIIEALVEQHIAKLDGNTQESLSAFAQTVCYVPSPEAQTVAPTQSQPDDNPSSTAFGDYELLNEIAKGGMGVVYKARHRKLNRIVALKMIRSGELAGEEQIKRFHSEAEAAAMLDHPGIVPVFEVGEANGQHFFSMAFVEGKSVHAKVTDDGPLAAKEAALLIRAVAASIEFAHDKGIVHRDIKPQNILLDENGEPRVTDFGLAKHVHGGSDLTATGQVMGTPSYMAPEQALGKIEDVGVSSDVYSVGATLYFLLTSRPPFQAASTMETLRQVIDADPAPLRQLNPDVPRDLETICLKCLRKESARRYSSAGALADDLGRWLEKKPIIARPVSRVEKTWLWCRRRPAVASLLVAMILLGGGGAAFVRQREYRQEAGALVDRLVTAESEDVPDIVDQMKSYWPAATPLLEKAGLAAELSGDDKALLHVRLALVQKDVRHADYLVGRLLNANVDKAPAIIRALSVHRNEIKDRLWRHIKNGSRTERIRSTSALAMYDATSHPWEQHCEDIVTALVSVPPSEADEWIEMLRPIESVLVDPLRQRFLDRNAERDDERPIVAAALSVYSQENPKRLAELIVLADNEREFRPLFLAIKNHKKSVVPILQALLIQPAPGKAETNERDDFWKKQSNAAICLLELGETKSVWPLFKQTPDPSLRSFLIDRIARLGASHEPLATQIGQETAPDSRYALIVALGQFDVANMSGRQRQQLAEQLTILYQEHPHPGVHSAAAWALRNWQQDRVATDFELASTLPKKDRNWFSNSQGQTFAIVNGPVEFLKGEKTESAEPKTVTIPHCFAMATHEVSVEQYQKFRSDHKYNVSYSPQSECPINKVSWYDAVAYCNWLNEQEGIPNDQWCYQPNGKGEYAEGMKIVDDFLFRTGYRLPTDEEWEFVCRAGTASSYGFGEPVELLEHYAAHFSNSESHTWPTGIKLPNGLGVFDMHGNAFEWCHSLYASGTDQGDVVANDAHRVLRGGAFYSHSPFVRSAVRFHYQPDLRDDRSGSGFRPARTCEVSP